MKNNISIEDLKYTFIKSNKFISLRLESELINFRKEYYNNSTFENISFVIVNDNNHIILPLTL